MQSCRFENFQVLPENRAAYDRCLRVANLEPGAAAPLVLVGGPAQGKTHLLWSMVHRVRELHPQTALALITAREFPEKVKQLAQDPGPIQRSRSAILLVDSLSQFREDAPILEAVVEVFLASRFAVVLASAILPIQIEAFSPAFRRRLTAADMVTLGGRPMPSTGAFVTQHAAMAPQRDTPRIAELEARNSLLTGERDALNAKLERSQRRIVQLEEEIAALLQKYAALEASERQGRDASRELVRSQGEAEAYRVEAETAREEREAARAAVRQLEHDNEMLRAEIRGAAESVREEMEAALHAAQQRAELATREAEAQQARAQEAAETAAQAGQDLRQIAQQSLGILEYLTALLPQASDATGDAAGKIAEYLEALRAHPQVAAEMLPLRLEQLVSGEESAAQRSLRAQLAQAASEQEMQAKLYEEARAAQAGLEVELALAQARAQALGKQRDSARQSQALLLAELDALRQQSRDELTQAQRQLAALQWQASELAERAAHGVLPHAQELAAALAAMANPSMDEEEPATPGPEAELFQEARKGRALLAEIATQMASAGKAPGNGNGQEDSGMLTRAVEEALGEGA